MIYDNSGSKISDVVTELHAITSCETEPCKFNVVKGSCFRKFL